MFSSERKKTKRKSMFRKIMRKRLNLAYKITALLLLTIYVLLFKYIMVLENQLENANAITAIYWATTTVATVGYGDVVFTSLPGRVFSIVVQVMGIILISGFLATYVITPWMDKVIKFRMPRKVPSGTKDHIIICGYNQLVETLIDELAEQEITFIIIEDEEDLIKELVYRDIPCIFGTPSDKQTLINAGIEKARVLIANKSDERNANIVLTAREFEHLNIIAIVEDLSNSKYLKYAGADMVVSPKSMFGQFIGRKAMDRLVSRVTGATEIFKGVHVTEFPVYLKSPLIGKTLKEVSSQKLTDARIVGIWKSGNLSFNPEEHDVIRGNSVLLAVGTPEELSKLKKLTH
ncbi:potassium channel protein [Methanosarcina sp. DH2]|uniref:potassium channel family protein n=2 Tax=unclassified Methanosarcina TaxID=2644672 RepID=UPI002ABBFA79|nr:potassium channel protein [Methanosarcina sp.]MCC4769670.1 potassium channel protein [Methanosarcina sp. DH2]MDY9925831.1 potassium channel protein [Methanosarcina sp.]